MTDNIIHDLTNRLDQLERSNTNLKRGLVGLVVAVAIGLSLGAALSNQADNQKDISCDSLRAKKIVISDPDGHERLVMELESGEPTLKMYDHEGHRQIFLGIDELWDDTAYLSVSSRLANGDVDKQAVIAAARNTTQLVLFDGHPQQKNAAAQHVVRLSSGLAEQKPFLEIQELSEKGADGIKLKLLEAKPAESGRRVLLETSRTPAELSGVRVSAN
jgi:hypothetical protein